MLFPMFFFFGGGGLIYVSRKKKQKRKSLFEYGKKGFLPYSVTVNVIINNAYLKIASLC